MCSLISYLFIEIDQANMANSDHNMYLYICTHEISFKNSL